MRKYISALLASAGGNFYSAVWPFIVAEGRVGPEKYGFFMSTANFISIFSRFLVGFVKSSSSVFSLGAVFYSLSALILLFGANDLTILLSLILSSTGFALVMIGIRVAASTGGRRGLQLGIVVSSGNLGVVMGGYLGVFTNNLLGRSYMLLMGSMISLSSILFMPRSGRSEPQRISLKLDRRIRRFILLSMGDSFVWALFSPFFFITAPKIVRASDIDIATAQALMMLSAILLNPLMGGLSDRGRRNLFMALSELTGAILVLIYGFPFGKISLFLSSFLMGLVIATWDPVSWAYVTERVGERDLLSQAGLWSSVTGLMRAVAPSIGGISYSALGHSLHMSLVSSLLLVLSFSFAFFLR